MAIPNSADDAQNEKKMEQPKQLGIDYIKEKNCHNLEVELKRLRDEIPEYKELYPRGFEQIKPIKNPDNAVQIMNFNMLADGLSGYLEGDTEKTFIKVPKKCLDFNYRGFRIVEEIARHRPDIVCVEECDQFTFLEHYLQFYEYKGVFKPKSKSPTTEIGERIKLPLGPDGVAVFWKYNKFNQVKDEDIKKFGSDVEKKPLVDVVGLAIILQLKQSKKEFMIIASHLKSAKDAEGETKRLSQLNYLLPTANAFLQKQRKKF